MKASLFSSAGDKVKDIDLPEAIFGITPNTHEMHRAFVRQMANWRAGTHSTLTRSEVRGGGRKPWKQKGTGRARAGSTRSPLWRGGGVIFGPKPRSYVKDLPRKIRRLALRSALATRKDAVRVMESWALEAPKTKVVAALLDRIGATGKVLLIVEARHELLERSARNLAGVRLILSDNLNVKDILEADVIVPTQGALEKITEVFAA
ncbi:MAG: 50S ribosomal protein L4 [Candidatus Sericytochromatia bacterium]|nr:50S ribosomal protein L4 [Candidatus Sericytochromatia bacterium]